MKRFKRFRGLAIAVAMGSLAVVAFAGENKPEPASVVSSDVKTIGEPNCVSGQQFQVKALVLKFKDGSGDIKETEFDRWQEATGRMCATSTDSPKAADVTAKGLEREASSTQAKAKSGPCWCFYKYYWVGTCIYYQVFDCDWNYCFTTSRCG